MRIRRIFVFIAALSVSTISVAQISESDMKTAKSVALSMGYSDQDITAAATQLGGVPSETGTNDVTRTEVEAPQPIAVLEPVTAEAANPNTIFGHDYFVSPGLSQVPSYNSPVPDKYVLGPGDEVVVDVWGASVSHVESLIGNDGSLTVPGLGPVYISGMTMSKAESVLKDQLSRIYSGLSGDRGDTYLRLSIGKIKGVSVNVSGEVITPGLYSIPSLTSIPSAIFMAGGVSENGSVRNISLFRHGKKVATFDLYDYLFKGKFNENLRLQDGDIISVDAYHNVVSITGAVMRPMRYELKEGESVSDLIAYANGYKTNAQRSSVHVSRVGEQANRDFDVASSQFSNFKLVDGDKVSVRIYRSVDENSVSIAGPVKYPGNYAIGGSITDVSSLISAAGGLVEGAFTGYGQISRINDDRQPEFLSFDVAKVLAGTERINLKREDVVVLYSKNDLETKKSVSISGAVNRPGTYSFVEGMTVAELVGLAGGLKEDAYLARGIISHNADGGKSAIAPFSVQEAVVDKEPEDVVLLCEDAVHIYSLKELRSNASITVNGEVNAPGTYTYRPGITLADLIEMAMGYTDGVDLSKVEIASRGGKERGSVMSINLEENPEMIQTVLSPYDVVSLRRLTYFRELTAVTVSGEVLSPGTYVVDKAEVRLSDIISRIGGFTDIAYVHGAKLIRMLTKEESERQILAVRIANQNLDEKSKIDTALLSEKYYIGIELDKAINNPGSISDVILRAGDIIEVPQMNNTVKVSGGVFYPNTVAYDKNLSWKGYIRQAGGFTKLARKNKTYAVYMNGKVAVGSGIKPEPGMEIIVPERNPSENQKMSPAEIASIASSTTSVATLVASIVRMFL